MGTQGVEFDATRFHWIGSMTEEQYVCFVRRDSPVDSLQDARRTPVQLAASGTGSGTYIFPNLMNGLLGTRFDIILGYSGSSEMNVAIERGEVHGRCNFWSSVKALNAPWMDPERPLIRFLVQFGSERHPELADVPLITEVATEQPARGIFQAVSSTLVMERPFAAPPGVPAERVAALRRAFIETLRDPQFLAEARAVHLEIRNPRSGETVQALVGELLRSPQDQVQILKRYWGSR